MTSEIIIKNPIVYDKKNGINGEKKDILISNGKIVENFTKESEVISIDGNGKIAYPGAIDLKSHFFAQEINYLRAKTLTEKNLARVPSYLEWEKQYLNSGFTFVCETDVPISQSKLALRNMQRVKIFDQAMILDLASNWILLHDFQDKRDVKYISATLSHILHQQKGYGISINNPYHQQFWNFNEQIPPNPEKIPIFRLNPVDIFIGLTNAIKFSRLRAKPFLSPYGMENEENEIHHLKLLKTVINAEKNNASTENGSNIHLSSSNHYFLNDVNGLVEFCKHEDTMTLDVTPLLTGAVRPLITRDRNLAMRESIKSKIPVSTIDLELDTEYYITTRDVSEINKENFGILTSWIKIILKLAKNNMLDRVSLASNAPYNMNITDWANVFAVLLNSKYKMDYLRQFPDDLIGNLDITDDNYCINLLGIEELTCYNPAKSLGLVDRKGHLGIHADADVILFDIDPENDIDGEDAERLISGFSNASTIIKGGYLIKSNGSFREDMKNRRFGKIFWNSGKVDSDTLKAVIKSKESFFDKYSSIYLDSLVNEDSDNFDEIT